MFLDVYPLEKPGAGKAEESDLLNKQHSEMVDLLTDNCHVVRIIAIKVCVLIMSSTYLEIINLIIFDRIVIKI